MCTAAPLALGVYFHLKLDGGGVAAEQAYFTRGLPNGIGGAVLVGDHLYGSEVGQNLVNGRLYIRDLGTLWAYDIKAR